MGLTTSRNVEHSNFGARQVYTSYDTPNLSNTDDLTEASTSIDSDTESSDDLAERFTGLSIVKSRSPSPDSDVHERVQARCQSSDAESFTSVSRFRGKGGWPLAT